MLRNPGHILASASRGEHAAEKLQLSAEEWQRRTHTFGPCRWLFSAARPVGDVKSLKALHRYNVVKAPAFAKATAWQANDEGRRSDEAGMQRSCSCSCSCPGISYESQSSSSSALACSQGIS